MPVTITSATISQARAILITCAITFVVLFTFSHVFDSPPLSPAKGGEESGVEFHHTRANRLAPSRAVKQGDPPGSVSEEIPISEDVIPHGVSVFTADNFVKHLVLPRMRSEDVTWLTYLPEDLNIIPKTYLIDPDKDITLPGTLTVPINKGHEAQAYLTYIIEHYDNLPDIAIFTHAHSTAWHNNDLQLSSTPVMLLELNYRRVVEHGYMNLRCHWHPGCPGWIKLNTTEYDDFKKEEFVMHKSFMELFPREVMRDGVPDILSTPCCAQFAVTRARIKQHAKERYIFWRKWITNTPLSDEISGRVMEYVWHFIFAAPSLSKNADRALNCPAEHVCYCDGYGYCFGNGDRFKRWAEKRDKARELSERLKAAEEGVGKTEGEDEAWREEGIKRWKMELKKMEGECETELQYARRRGSDAKMRRGEVGELEFSG
ncbi:hypothetical protein L873DRAFT_1677084 [Choiromyces venosus 120613-1]|uniref:Uncharacterized protein n=1 Tax=Choiromyces venosus 120613-1 TaxID=1336337 RepID=A0A3N4JSH4_9PEZI|nr:hypothetical protein L873DRAFT_1677084 [Choiromyces venosus 120613-1]